MGVRWTFSRPETGICVLLALVTLGLYWPVTSHPFVLYDDPLYVTENQVVQRGLTVDGVRWAFSTMHAANWHPVTWLSHMLDVSLFKLNAGAHHFTSLVFHVINSLLLFLLLKRLTSALWPSAFVAALFAWHPLHAESVAWVAERKDVLSTFFWLATLGSYVKYTERPGAGRYAFTLLLFALGLLSKPMTVTVPCVLLLLDWWPLRRLGGGEVNGGGAGAGVWRRQFLEKTPFFAMSLALGLVTILAQHEGGTINSMDKLPLADRFANAGNSYVGYLGKMVWPADLAVFYPMPSAWSWWKVTACMFFMAGVTVAAARNGRRRPWLLAGWLWYLVTLFPVIGLLQAGNQAMAERYTYVPLIGVFIAVAWMVQEWMVKIQRGQSVAAVVAALALLGCVSRTSFHLQCWSSSYALFENAARSTSGNFVAHNNMGSALKGEGRLEESTAHFMEAVRLKPDYDTAQYNLALNLAELGHASNAIRHFSEVVRLKKDTADYNNTFGFLLARNGHVSEAIPYFNEALRRDANMAGAHYNLALAFASSGEPGDAIAHHRAALKLVPNWIEPMQNLAWLLASSPDSVSRDGAEAVQLAEKLCAFTKQDDARHLDILAAAYAEANRFDEAQSVAKKAVSLAESRGAKDHASQMGARLKLYESGQPFRQPSQRATDRH